MFLTKIKEFFAKGPHMVRIVFSSVVILFAVVVGLFFLIGHLGEDTVSDVSGRVDVGFRVFYLENDVFADNPIPPNLNFLMSFTDYIEVDNRFFVYLSDEVEIHYSYSAVKRMNIRHVESHDADRNPIVFELVTPLSKRYGQVVSNSVSLPGNNGSSSSNNASSGSNNSGNANSNANNNANGNINGAMWSYAIDPKYYIDIYFDFIAAQLRQMAAENVVALGQRGFSAELFIDFTYNIAVPEWDFSESITRGYRFQLSTEVYSLAVTGMPTFEASVVLGEQSRQLTLPVIIIIAGALAMGVYGLLSGIRLLQAHPDEKVQEAQTILRKYANEIVVSQTPLSLSSYSPVDVADFDSLLRLAINLNKHIMGYHDDEQAAFAVIVDGYVYRYVINYGSGIARAGGGRMVTAKAVDERVSSHK